MAYYQESGYTFLAVRRLMQASEARNSPFTAAHHPAHGHASTLHQTIDDAGLVGRLKMLSSASAFKDSATTSFGSTIKTQDQAFLLAEILNSKLGRAALQALDTVGGGTLARLTICYIVANTSAFALREASLVIPSGVSKNQAKMNVNKYGVVNNNTPMQQIIGVFDNGHPDLHIVTCFPASESDVATYGNFGGYKLETAGGAAPTLVKWPA